MAKKKAEDMRAQLKTIITFSRGISAWEELLKTEGDIRKRRQKAIYDQKERQRFWIELILSIIILSATAALLVGGIWWLWDLKNS